MIQVAKANKPAKTGDNDGGALVPASGQSISKLAKREINRQPFVMAPDWSKLFSYQYGQRAYKALTLRAGSVIRRRPSPRSSATLGESAARPCRLYARGQRQAQRDDQEL